MSFFRPGDANGTPVTYGIDNEVTGFIIQNEDITDTLENLEINDQKGRTCQVLGYQKGKNLSFTMIGGDTLPTGWSIGSTISYGGTSYIIQDIKRTCVYNDTAKWSIDAVHYENATYSNKINQTL